MTDFKRLLATYAPLVPAAAVVAAVVIGLSGYETPTYAVTEYSAEESIIEETTEKTVKQKEDKPAIGTGAFDVPDGTYQGSGTGFGGTVTVSVTIREKTITAVDILSHSDTPSFFSRAEAQVVAAILAEQKADVDAVSGATLSSNGIMQAVRNALHTAAGEETEALAEASGSSAAGGESVAPVSRVAEPSSYKDGVYRGSGVGFAGAVTTVEVTVSGGRIASIGVVSYGDTTSYFLNARDPVISAIVAGQTTNVDTVSGATFSSNGIITAVRSALAKAAGENSSPSDQEKEKEEKEETVFDYEDGIYVGVGEGYNDEIRLALTIRDKKLAAITVLYEDDTPEFFSMAQEIIRTIVNDQNTEADAVSGATFSSEGILEAVADALENAKKGITILDIYEEKDDSKPSDESDSSKDEPAEPGSFSDNDPGKSAADDSAGSGSASDNDPDESSKVPADDSSSDDSSAESDANLYENGSFTGTAVCTADEDEDFIDYNLTLTVVLENDKITAVTDIAGDGDADNDSFIRRAANGTKKTSGLVERILTAGTPDGIDTVSGATCTSKAIIEAVKNAMDQARK